jgi:Styrene monooxygenase A putative substrate binding domain/Pyridine nucleotide-disulphide oxidoreductase
MAARVAPPDAACMHTRAPRIGIVGAGVAGLQLALFLRQHGVETTIFTDRTPVQLLGSRLPSTVCRFAPTRDRERALGAEHWDDPALATNGVHFSITGAPLQFSGAFARAASFVDMRLYQATLLEDAANAGVRVVNGALHLSDVLVRAKQHDLLVIATGRGRLSDLFPRVEDRSPYAEPQRRLFAGLFNGIAHASQQTLSFAISPGHGEIFTAPFFTLTGLVSGILVEAIPGGDLEPLTHTRYADDPAGFETALIDALRVHAPMVFERIDRSAFALTGPLDLLQGAITPVVRAGFVEIKPGVFAQAIGDAHVLNDPIMGQGANAASFAARTLGEAILSGGPFDAQFCTHVEQRIWAYTRSVTEWSNASLQQPPPHVLHVFEAASNNSAIADAVVDSFGYPQRAWSVFGSPDGASAFVRSFESAAA